MYSLRRRRSKSPTYRYLIGSIPCPYIPSIGLDLLHKLGDLAPLQPCSTSSVHIISNRDPPVTYIKCSVHSCDELVVYHLSVWNDSTRSRLHEQASVFTDVNAKEKPLVQRNKRSFKRKKLSQSLTKYINDKAESMKPPQIMQCMTYVSPP